MEGELLVFCYRIRPLDGPALKPRDRICRPDLGEDVPGRARLGIPANGHEETHRPEPRGEPYHCRHGALQAAVPRTKVLHHRFVLLPQQA